MAEELKSYRQIDFFEEAVKSGGIGEHLSAILFENGFKGEYNIHAINNEFVPMSSVDSAIKKYGLDCDAMSGVAGSTLASLRS